jgi:hypothetical protein
MSSITKANKYINRASWLSAAIGLFTGAIAMLTSINSVFILYTAFTVTDHPVPLTVIDYFTFSRALITLVISGIMITNTHKFGKGKIVSSFPYFFLLFFLILEIIVNHTLGDYNHFALIFRSIIPLLTVLALISLHQSKKVESSHEN